MCRRLDSGETGPPVTPLVRGGYHDDVAREPAATTIARTGELVGAALAA